MIVARIVQGIVALIRSWTSRPPQDPVPPVSQTIDTENATSEDADVSSSDASQEMQRRVSQKPSDEGATNIRKQREAIANTVADIIERFESASRSNLAVGSHVADTEKALSLLFGCDFHLLAEESAIGSKDERVYFNPTNDAVDLAASVWPIDFATITRKPGGYFLARLFSADNKEIRGRTRLFATKNVIYVYGFMSDDGDWWAEQQICGLVGGKWVGIDVEVARAKGGYTCRRTKSDPSELNNTIAVTFSIALTERYSWHVAFGAEDGPRVVMPTDAKGASTIFKDREKASNESRRSALRHWVVNHYRSTTDSLAYVRDHLRGAVRFVWKDTPVELLVSSYDLERDAFFKEQADQWRAARKHNRVRVRLKRASN